jgi:hypothetical protein
MKFTDTVCMFNPLSIGLLPNAFILGFVYTLEVVGTLNHEFVKYGISKKFSNIDTRAANFI